MSNDTLPNIFLSYSWANLDIANEIDTDFQSVGITFHRDVRDVKYTESIKDFMHRIGKSDFVVMLISDQYIKSENCMYEVTELLNAHEFEKRILPVIIGNAAVYSSAEHEKYFDYWYEKLESVKRILTKHQNEKTLEDKKKIQGIYDHLGEFFKKITDLKAEKYEDLKKNDYKQMLDKIGFDKEAILQKAMEIYNIIDKEDQELACEELLQKHPDNKNILFVRAAIANKNKLYKKAKKYYNDLLLLYPSYAFAHNNFGNLLKNHFHDFLEAKNHYEMAIKLDAEYARPHYNLALLLKNHLTDYNGAKNHLEKAIEIDSQYAAAHNNLGSLLASHFLDYENARKHFEISIEISPQSTTSLYNLALLLETQFLDNTGAKKIYEKVIEIDPQHKMAKNNLAHLLRKRVS